MTVNGKPVNSGAFRMGGSAVRIKPGTWQWQPGNTTETQRKHWKGTDEDPIDIYIDIYRSYMILFILTPSIPIHLVNSAHISGSMVTPRIEKNRSRSLASSMLQWLVGHGYHGLRYDVVPARFRLLDRYAGTPCLYLSLIQEGKLPKVFSFHVWKVVQKPSRSPNLWQVVE